jgi:hypothetical protein
LLTPIHGGTCGDLKKAQWELGPLLEQAKKRQGCRNSRDEESVQLGSETLRIQVGGKPPLVERLRSAAAGRVNDYG